MDPLKFKYSIQNNRLFLKQTDDDDVDFSFLGIGFKKNQIHEGEPLSEWIPRINEDDALTLLSIEASRYPNSEQFLQLKEIDSDFVYQTEDEIIFFGGSFHPWHDGHKACLDLLGPKSCIILPDRNPFKEHRELDIRGTYLELTEKIDENYHHINPEFILKTNKNPTYTWIQMTRDRFPGAKLSLLMGMDSLMSIERWFEAEKLLSTLNCLYVASRMEKKEDQIEMKKKLSIYPQLHIHFLGNHPHESLSSTKIREQK